MQSIDKFNSNLGTAILLSGPAGGGKTVLGMRLFPRTYCLVADLNFKSGIDYLRSKGETDNIVGFDTVTVDEEGKPVKPLNQYDRFWKKVNEAVNDTNVDAILIDSATVLEDVIKAKICSATDESKIKLSNYDQWGSYLITWKGVIMQLRQSGKKLIMTAHERKERDESDGIYKYQIALDGQIRDKFPAMFSDVWRCEVQEANNKHTWMVRTLGNVRHELKNTRGLPALLPADDLVKKFREEFK